MDVERTRAARRAAVDQLCAVACLNEATAEEAEELLVLVHYDYWLGILERPKPTVSDGPEIEVPEQPDAPCKSAPPTSMRTPTPRHWLLPYLALTLLYVAYRWLALTVAS